MTSEILRFPFPAVRISRLVSKTLSIFRFLSNVSVFLNNFFNSQTFNIIYVQKSIKAVQRIFHSLFDIIVSIILILENRQRCVKENLSFVVPLAEEKRDATSNDETRRRNSTTNGCDTSTCFAGRDSLLMNITLLF